MNRRLFVVIAELVVCWWWIAVTGEEAHSFPLWALSQPSCDFLSFPGLCRSLSRPSGVALVLEIGGLVIVGLLFALPSVLSIVWALDHPNRKRKVVGVFLIALYFPLVLTFYGWALFGHPLKFWGL